MGIAGAAKEVNRHRLTLLQVCRALAQPLPGAAAHQPMAPEPRPGWSPGCTPPDCRESGVLLLLFPRDGQLHFVLTRRTEQVAAHKGQVSLPGGGRHPGEALAETALRETSEELGIGSDAVELIGHLSSLYVPVSNYCVFPFVGYRATAPRLRPNPQEVAAVLEVPLAALLDAGNRRVEHWDDPGFVGGRRIPCFQLNGWLVWGATAMILNEMGVLLAAALVPCRREHAGQSLAGGVAGAVE